MSTITVPTTINEPPTHPASGNAGGKSAAKLRCHSRNVGVQRCRVALVGFPSA